MKRILFLSMCLIICLSVVSCRGNDTPDITGEPTASASQTEPDSQTELVETSAPIDPIIEDIENIKMETVLDGVVCRISDETLKYCGWPSVCADDKGTLYAVCSGGRLAHICPFGKTFMMKSVDNGVTWSDYTVINDTILDDRDAGIVYLGNGKMLMTYFTRQKEYYLDRYDSILNAAKNDDKAYALTKEKLDSLKSLPDSQNIGGSFIKLSDDYGVTWSEAQKIDISSPHGPIAIDSENLLYLGKEFYSSTGLNNIRLFGSKDGGKTWEAVSTVPIPDNCAGGNLQEPSLVRLADGTLLGAMRVENDKLYPSLTVYLFRSTDGGLTWTKPEPTGLKGSPPHLLALADGTILLTYCRRDASFGVRAVLSVDGGLTWSRELSLSRAGSWDCGYPCSVQLADGSILTVYYQIYQNDTNNSILYKIWKVS